MLHKLLALSLAFILSLAPPRLTFSQTQPKDAGSTARVKAEIARRGAGKKARVAIKLRSGRQLNGRIDQADDRTFTLTDEKTGKSTSIAYTDVQRVSSSSFSKRKKTGIIAALAVGVLVLVGVLSFKNFHPFENGVLR